MGQIPRHVGDAELRGLFEPFGTIVELTILRDKTTQAHRSASSLQQTQMQAADTDANAAEQLSSHSGQRLQCQQREGASQLLLHRSLLLTLSSVALCVCFFQWLCLSDVRVC